MICIRSAYRLEMQARAMSALALVARWSVVAGFFGLLGYTAGLWCVQ
jgi:hypothetical protein